MGGDAVQLEKTKIFLEQLGVKVDVSTDPAPQLKSYDAVYLFNIGVIDDTYRQCLNAKKQNKPIILATVYWNKDEYLFRLSSKKVKLFKLIFGDRLTRYLIKHRRYLQRDWSKQRAVLKSADPILVMSRQELSQLERDFKLRIKNFRLIPNGVETSIFTNGSAERFEKRFGLKNFVLCVARFDDLKNQSRLIEILGGDKIDLVLIGRSNPRFGEYYNSCLRQAARFENIHLLPPLKPTDLADAYAAAKVHVMPSLFEVFSTTTLEAAAAGCNIVITDRSCFKDIFGDLMRYCDPLDDKSIEREIYSAYQQPKSDRLRNLIIREYDWLTVARKILSALKETVGRND